MLSCRREICRNRRHLLLRKMIDAHIVPNRMSVQLRLVEKHIIFSHERLRGLNISPSGEQRSQLCIKADQLRPPK